MQGQASILISASAEAVYELVSDITRMGEWSPECTSGEWLDGATGPAVGAQFKGTNKLGPYKWSTSPVVTVAEPGKTFAFDAGATEWRYEFAPADGGTRVTESYRITSTLTKLYTAVAVVRKRGLVKGMQKTLERIKAAAEA